jgi:hypothetical protein
MSPAGGKSQDDLLWRHPAVCADVGEQEGPLLDPPGIAQATYRGGRLLPLMVDMWVHAVVPPPDLLQLVPGIPVGLAAPVARLLAKDPDDRYQSGEELAADLRLLAEGPHAPVDARGAGGFFDGPARVPLSGRARELAQLALLASRWDATRGGTGRAPPSPGWPRTVSCPPGPWTATRVWPCCWAANCPCWDRRPRSHRRCTRSCRGRRPGSHCRCAAGRPCAAS